MGENRYTLLWGPLDKDGRPEMTRVVLFEGRADAEIFARMAHHIAAIRPAGHAFSWLAILTPKRIWNEDVGDALETICAMERAGCSRLKIKAKVISTYFWVLIAVARELVAALTGRKSPHR